MSNKKNNSRKKRKNNRNNSDVQKNPGTQEIEKKTGKYIKAVLLFAVYLGILVVLGFMLFTGKGSEEVSKADNENEEITENTTTATSEDKQELTTSKVVIVSQVNDMPERDTYNGDDLCDNGSTYAVKINRKMNIVTIYALDEDGYYTVPVKAMRCSVSLDDTTPTGLFETSDRFEWALLEGGVYGQFAYKIHGGILFHSVPYTAQGNNLLETWEYNKLGTGASLGCIRLCVADARWIFYNCEEGTQVNIFDSDYEGPMGIPQAPYTFEDVSETDWDPTDMAYSNDYNKEPHIYGAYSHTVEMGTNYDESAGVMAFSSAREDVTDTISIDGQVDTSVPGDYEVTYSFADGLNKVEEKIVITVEDTTPPVITTAPQEINVKNYTGNGDELAELISEYITAYDGDSEITDCINLTDDNKDKVDKTNVITIEMPEMGSEAGTYVAVCTAYDTYGNSSEKVNININVE
jgi:uncharacterized protein YpmS